MSLNEIYVSFKDASEKCKNFLEVRCFKCHYCNNCPCCDLYCNLTTINDWLLEHFKNPYLLTNDTKRALVFKEIQIINSLHYSYDHHCIKLFRQYNSYEEILEFNSCIRDLIFLCLCIIRNYNQTKILDNKGNIISVNNNDTILTETASSLFQQLIKARCYLEVPYIISCIKENKICTFLNKEIINELIKYTLFDIKIFYDLINNPDKYYNFINKNLHLYYVKNVWNV